MKQNPELDGRTARLLDPLRNQPERDPALVARGRAAFLAEAKEVAASLPKAVSATRNRRHNRWMHSIQSVFSLQRKEPSTMFGALGTILLIVSLALGGSGITIAVAQQSLPDDGLYPVKTWSEGVRVRLAENEQDRLQLALELANRRAEEVRRMLQAGQTPPQGVQNHWQAELDLAVQLAVGQPDEEAVRSLEQVREQVQAQEITFRLGSPSPVNARVAAAAEQARAMLRERLRQCEEGIHNPSALREQLRNRDRNQGGHHPTSPVPGATQNGTPSPHPAGTNTSGGGKGPGAQHHGTAAPGGMHTPESGYGPGPGANNPWTEATATSGTGYGAGHGDGEGDQGSGSGENNPWTEEVPTPGSGSGPGPGDGGGTQSGGNGPGPQPEEGSENGGSAGGSTGSESGSGGTTGSGSGSGDTGGSGSGSGPDAGHGEGSSSGKGGHH